MKNSFTTSPTSISFNKSSPQAKEDSFSQKYKLKSLLGQGAYGKVFEIASKSNQEVYVAKFSEKICNEFTLPSKESDFKKESIILRKLQGKSGFPKFKEYLSFDSKEVMIMTRLGRNLEDLAASNGGRFSLKTILMIGTQCIQLLEKLHDAGYVHRDIKPANFVIGATENEFSEISMIDFGLSSSYLDGEKNHISLARRDGICGTLSFMSLYGMLGIEASRRDDMISLGYMLIWLFKGELPWTNLEKRKENFKTIFKKMYKAKLNMTLEELCKGLPSDFEDYFSSVLLLDFKEKPNYKSLIGIFQKIMLQNGLKNDGIFDWNLKKANQGIDLGARKITGPPLKEYARKTTDSCEFLGKD